MKELMFSLLLLIVSIIPIEAQFQVVEEIAPMSAGSQPALTVKLKGVDPKFADTEWKEYMKIYGKAVKVKGSKESVIEDIHIGAVGSGELLNVYHYAEEIPDGTRMIVWVDIGGNFLSSKDKEYSTAVGHMENYAHKVKVDLVAIDLEKQHEVLKKFEGNFEKLQKENENLHKIITDSEAKIAQTELDLQDNATSQESAQAEIASQKSVVESVQDNPAELKAQQKQLSKLESNYTRLQKENDSLNKLIKDSNAKITQAELDIKTNLQAQDEAQLAIKNQRIVVDTVQAKLDTLRSEKPGEKPVTKETEKE